MVSKYPPQYVVQLLPCFKPECCHPVCKRSVGAVASEICWFPGGPQITYLPIPVLDPERPWGNPECQECKGFCCGHYLKPSIPIAPPTSSSSVEPPSAVLYRALSPPLLVTNQNCPRKFTFPQKKSKSGYSILKKLL